MVASRASRGNFCFIANRNRKRRVSKNTRRRAADRESVVWGKLVDCVGLAPSDVKWVHVDDRGADDVEVFCRIQAQRKQLRDPRGSD